MPRRCEGSHELSDRSRGQRRSRSPAKPARPCSMRRNGPAIRCRIRAARASARPAKPSCAAAASLSGAKQIAGAGERSAAVPGKTSQRYSHSSQADQRHDPAARKNITASVYRVTRPADDVVTLMLRFPAGIRARFKAGQYLRVQMPDGDTRNFSMANRAARERRRAIAYQAHSRAGSFRKACWRGCRRATSSRSKFRSANFYLRTGSDKPIVCLATGTGFAPLKSIIEDLIARGNSRRVRFYWGGRRRQDLYLANLPDKWAARAPWLTFIPVLSEPDAGLARRDRPGSSSGAARHPGSVGLAGLCLRQSR